MPQSDVAQAGNPPESTPSQHSIDPPVQQLVDALNAFDAVTTIGSCGGHAEPSSPAQWAEGTWYVKFRVARTADGWRALEFLAWLLNNAYQRADHHVSMYPTAPPPYLNEPGAVLAFALEGYDGEDANELAEFMDTARRDAYIPPVMRALASRQERLRLARRRR